MRNLILIFLITILTSCATQEKFTDVDYSYARSGGFAPIYENLLIKGNKGHYSFEGHQNKIKKNFRISNTELANIQKTLNDNEFRKIQEDYQKLYDNISTSIIVKQGDNSGSKSDASMIRPENKQQWDRVVLVFQELISKHVKSAPEK